MEIHVRHNPSFSVARAILGPSEAIRAESGAMMAMAADTNLDAKIEGGLMKGLKRSVLGGESLFITTATAAAHGGWIDFAPSLPGDVTVFDVRPDQPLMVQKGSFLCAEQGVDKVRPKQHEFPGFGPGSEQAVQVFGGAPDRLLAAADGILPRIEFGIECRRIKQVER